MKMVMLFAGVQKDDPTKLHAIMKFPNMEAFQASGSNEELAEERKKESRCCGVIRCDDNYF